MEKSIETEFTLGYKILNINNEYVTILLRYPVRNISVILANYNTLHLFLIDNIEIVKQFEKCFICLAGYDVEVFYYHKDKGFGKILQCKDSLELITRFKKYEYSFEEFINKIDDIKNNYKATDSYDNNNKLSIGHLIPYLIFGEFVKPKQYYIIKKILNIFKWS